MNIRLAGPLAALALSLTPSAHASEPRVDLHGDPLPEGAVARLGTVRFRTLDAAWEAQVSPDGKRVAARGDHDLLVFDADTGRILREVSYGPGDGTVITWLPDGRGALLWSDNPRNPRLVDFTGPDVRLPVVPRTTVKKSESKVDGPALIPPSDRPSLFAFSADGRLLAAEGYDTASRTRAVTVREVALGKRLRELNLVRDLGAAPGECVGLQFTRDGKALGVLGTSDKKGECVFALWDLATGKERFRRAVPSPAQRTGRGCFALSPDGRRLAVGLDDGTARIFDLAGDGSPRSFARHARSGGHGLSQGVSALAFSPDGKLLVTAGLDNMLRGWDSATLEEVRPAQDAGEWIRSVAFSPDGKTVVTAGEGHAVRRWDAVTFREAEASAGHFGFVLCAKVSPDGKTVVTTGADETLRAWDLATGRERRRINTGGWIARRLALQAGGRIGVSDRIDSYLALAADGKTALLTVDQTLRAWDVTTGAKVALPGELARATGVCYGFGPGGRTLILVDRGSVTLWEWPSGRRLRTIDFADPRRAVPGESCSGADLSPDGVLLATSLARPRTGGMAVGFADTCVWDTTTGKRVTKLECSAAGEAFPRFLPSAQALVLATRHGWLPFPRDGEPARVLGLWDCRTGKLRQVFPVTEPSTPDRQFRHIGDITLSPDGRTLAAAGEGGAVLYEVASGQVRRHLRHGPMALGVAFTPDGRRLVTAGSDCNALVWDTTLAGSAKRAGPLADGERRGLWSALSAGPAQTTFETMARLAADGPAAVAFLEEHLRPVPKLDGAATDRLFRDLESDRFAARQGAAAELDRLGKAAVGPARERLRRTESEDGRERLRRFLDRQAQAAPTAEELRQGRAVELLEAIATPEARALLRELAAGDPAAPLTRDAAESLRRLEK